MTTIYNLRASNNSTFQWTRDLSEFATTYDLAAVTFRMHARTTAAAPDPPAYEWVSTNTAGGQISFNPVTNLAVFTAPESGISALSGDYAYDCRLETLSGAAVVLFGGMLSVSVGVTREMADKLMSGVLVTGDTVTVDGERTISPVPLPLELSAAIAAAQGASLTPAALLAAFAAFSPLQIAQLQAIIGTSSGGGGAESGASLTLDLGVPGNFWLN